MSKHSTKSRSLSRSSRRSKTRSSSRSKHSRSPDKRRRSLTSSERYRYCQLLRKRDKLRGSSRSSSRSSLQLTTSSKRYRNTRRSRSGSRSNSSPKYHHKSYERRRTHSRSPLSQRRRHVGTRDHPQECKCLGIFGLSVHTTEQKIYQIFSKFGPIEHVQIVIDAKTGKSRGFCFVYYQNLEDAKQAKEQLCGIEIDDRRIRVDYSITKRAHTPTPGVYMGRPTKSYREREYRDRDRYRDEVYHREKIRYKENRNRTPPSPCYSRDRKRRYDRSRSRSYSRDRSDRRYYR